MTKMELSEIMRGAHFYYSKGLFPTFSECLRKSWSRMKFLKSLKSSKVEFKYIKSDKSERIALGTLNKLFFSYESKGGRVTPLDLIPYWDLNANGFRSCRIERLILS